MFGCGSVHLLPSVVGSLSDDDYARLQFGDLGPGVAFDGAGGFCLRCGLGIWVLVWAGRAGGFPSPSV